MMHGREVSSVGILGLCLVVTPLLVKIRSSQREDASSPPSSEDDGTDGDTSALLQKRHVDLHVRTVKADEYCCALWEKGVAFDSWVAARREASGGRWGPNMTNPDPWSAVVISGTFEGAYSNRAAPMFHTWFQRLLPGMLALFHSESDDPKGELPLLFLRLENYPAYARDISGDLAGYMRYQHRTMEMLFLMAVAPPVEYNWYLLNDDDNFVIPKGLGRLLDGRDPEEASVLANQLSGCIGICGGAGILFSRGVTRLLAEQMPEIRQSYPERVDYVDTCISTVVEQHARMHPENASQFMHPGLPLDFPNLGYEALMDSATFHYVVNEDAQTSSEWFDRCFNLLDGEACKGIVNHTAMPIKSEVRQSLAAVAPKTGLWRSHLALRHNDEAMPAIASWEKGIAFDSEGHPAPPVAPWEKGVAFDSWVATRLQGSGGSLGQEPWTAVVTPGTFEGSFDSRARLMFRTWFQRLLPGMLAFFHSETDDANGELPIMLLRPDQYPSYARSFTGDDAGYKRYQHRTMEMIFLMAADPPVEYKWYMLNDDDNFVIPRGLLRLVDGHDPANLTVLAHVGCDGICGGAGIVFSRGLMKHIGETLPAIRGKYPKEIGFVDVTVASWLLSEQCGLRAEQAFPKLNAGGPGPEIPPLDDPLDAASYHYVSDEAVYKFDKCLNLGDHAMCEEIHVQV
eukprot:gnl/TRDRNA2_/TRDRNA2_181751_c0_seq1.p1 gnl/TRDRNA2_/TRDRNA2_181751_c0~~gnl/TRDRNA2_/TRDRNA2_181751_c0_seq1.p1  ORF type:complete len:683 (+),score=106.18 gnl/TRDRNA2_/TRDRNA2_181751_c0_seq1:93-2141(+)